MTRLVQLTNLIKEFEGCRLTAYLCPAGKWTVGWGQTGPYVKPGLVWTQQQADDALSETASLCMHEALMQSPILMNSSDNRLIAISDFIYNLGPMAYQGSTLHILIDSGNWTGAQMEIQKWVHIHKFGKAIVEPGLVRRRVAEAALLGNSPSG